MRKVILVEVFRLCFLFSLVSLVLFLFWQFELRRLIHNWGWGLTVLGNFGGFALWAGIKHYHRRKR